MAIQQFEGGSSLYDDVVEKRQQQQRRPKWLYWCIPRNMEWHWVDPYRLDAPYRNDRSGSHNYGALTATKMDNLCITAGITVGFATGVREVEVPIFAHDKIVVTLREAASSTDDTTNVTCGTYRPVDCLQFVQNFVFGAIRSRTPTSAGMWNVQLDDEHMYVDPSSFYNYAMWDQMHKSFGLQREPMNIVNQYLTDHLIEIAMDNLMGQCTKGHSCKEKARKSLEQLIAERRNYTQQHQQIQQDTTPTS